MSPHTLPVWPLLQLWQRVCVCVMVCVMGGGVCVCSRGVVVVVVVARWPSLSLTSNWLYLLAEALKIAPAPGPAPPTQRINSLSFLVLVLFCSRPRAIWHGACGLPQSPDSVAQLAERLAVISGASPDKKPEGPRFNPVPSLYFLFVFGSAAPYPPPFCYSLVCCVCA